MMLKIFFPDLVYGTNIHTVLCSFLIWSPCVSVCACAQLFAGWVHECTRMWKPDVEYLPWGFPTLFPEPRAGGVSLSRQIIREIPFLWLQRGSHVPAGFFYVSYALPSSSSHVSTARSLSAELFLQPASFIDYFLTVLLVGTLALKIICVWGVTPSPQNWAAENISRGFRVRTWGTAGLAKMAQDPQEVAFKVSPGIRVYF